MGRGRDVQYGTSSGNISEWKLVYIAERAREYQEGEARALGFGGPDVGFL